MTQHLDIYSLTRYREFFCEEALKLDEFWEPRNHRTLVLMPPKQFTRLAFPLSYGKKHRRKESRTDEHLGEWHELPYLRIQVNKDTDEALVIAHEGRHRTIMMDSRDVPFVPVILWVSQNPDKELPFRGHKMRWGIDPYRPKLLRSQNEKMVMPMPLSLTFPQLEQPA